MKAENRKSKTENNDTGYWIFDSRKYKDQESRIKNQESPKSTSKFVRATSLIEVIVVLAIVSMTLISAMNLVIRASSAIKDSEIQDTAHGVQLKALEALKSQEDVKISSDLLVTNMIPATVDDAGPIYKFSLQDLGTGGKILKYQPLDTQPSLTTCDSSSPYYISGLNMNICLKIEIQRGGQTYSGELAGVNYYIINAKVSYVTGRDVGIKEEKLITYRYGALKN